MQVPGFVTKPAKRAGSTGARLAKRTTLGVVAAIVVAFVLVVLDAILLGEDDRGPARTDSSGRSL